MRGFGKGFAFAQKCYEKVFFSKGCYTQIIKKLLQKFGDEIMRCLLLLPATVLLLTLSSIMFLHPQDQESFSLTLLYTNDSHTQHLPHTSGDGGAARLATLIKEIRTESENLILLDAGDRFSDRHTRPNFHKVHKGIDNVRVMNLLGYDAMTLGNHEFDDGDRVLANLVRGVEFPIVAANIDFSASPTLGNLGIERYTILNVNGEQIGVIGLVSPDTPSRSHPGKELIFSDELVTIANSLAAELTARGVNKIILLTHIGINNDRRIAPQLVNIDVIVGGDSHTLLSNQDKNASGAYPLVFTNESTGEAILYVQAKSRNLYLGRLELQFDADGVLTSWGGDTIFVSRSLAPDPEMQALID
jgi:5'-nucleotidase / UDP-sugar diphosphatase